jgi:hypothetical protein
MAIPQSRNVLVAFRDSPDKRMTIPRRGSVLAHVSAKLTDDEMSRLVGVKDSTGTAWID